MFINIKKRKVKLLNLSSFTFLIHCLNRVYSTFIDPICSFSIQTSLISLNVRYSFNPSIPKIDASHQALPYAYMQGMSLGRENVHNWIQPMIGGSGSLVDNKRSMENDKVGQVMGK